MLKLHGVAASNYYNKAKFVLLETGLPFEEVIYMPTYGGGVAPPGSPLGKIPFLTTAEGMLCETDAIIGYLEKISPAQPLFLSDPFAAAKQHEASLYIELYVELVARELYTPVFAGETVDAATLERTRSRLERGLAGLRALTRFEPYVCGEQFGLADITAYVHLSLVANLTRRAFNRDLIGEAGIDWAAHRDRVGQRPAAQRINADRKAFTASRAAGRS